MEHDMTIAPAAARTTRRASDRAAIAPLRTAVALLRRTRWTAAVLAMAVCGVLLPPVPAEAQAVHVTNLDGAGTEYASAEDRRGR